MKSTLVRLVLYLSFYTIKSSQDRLIYQEKQVAESFLDNPRLKRAVGVDEYRSHHIERECNEELCSKNEYLKIKDHEGKNLRRRLENADENMKKKFDRGFETYYTECHDKVIKAGLDDRNGLDFRGYCVTSFLEPMLEEMELFL